LLPVEISKKLQSRKAVYSIKADLLPLNAPVFG
jgi:hypothetical protein